MINSLGEGAVLVDDENGDIAVGDLITTGENGYGSKQSDDIVHSYTVGKATTTAVYIDGKALIGCVYMCG